MNRSAHTFESLETRCLFSSLPLNGAAGDVVITLPAERNGIVVSGNAVTQPCAAAPVTAVTGDASGSGEAPVGDEVVQPTTVDRGGTHRGWVKGWARARGHRRWY